MTNTEMVDELTHLKTQFVNSIDNLIKKVSSEATCSNTMTHLLQTRTIGKPNYTKEEIELKGWFDRPAAIDDEPKYTHRFWGRFPSVEEAFEHSESDDFKFLNQLNKAFYGIAYHILKKGNGNNETTEEIVEKVIYEANIFIYCANLQSTRGFDMKFEFKFIKNVKKVVSLIENGTMK